MGDNSLGKAFKFYGMGAHSIPSIFHRQNVSDNLDFQHENTENLMLYLCISAFIRVQKIQFLAS